MKQRRATTALASLASIMAVTGAGIAQDQADDDETLVFDTIVITAQRREQNLQDVPVAVSAYSADDLVALSAQRLDDLQFASPNLVFTGQPNNGSPEFSIRGITSATPSIGSDSAIAFYIDGVYVGRNAGFLMDLLNIDQVQVLRGPQGTLFGRNSTGGAILVSTRAPSDSFTGQASLEYGAFDHLRARGLISGPITEKLSALLGVSFVDSDGYIDNLFDNRRFNGQGAWNAQAQLRYQASEATEFILRSDFLDEKRERIRAELTQDSVFPGFPGTVPGPYSVNIDGDVSETRENWGISLVARTQIGDHDLESISAYRDLANVQRDDEDKAPIPAVVGLNPGAFTSQQFSQEVRLTSPSDQSFRYIVGLFFFDQKATNQTEFQTLFISPTEQVAYGGEIETQNYSVFGQFDYDLTDRLTLTAGIRATIEEKDFVFSHGATPIVGAAFGVPTFNISDKRKDDNISPTVSLQYAISENTMTYARFSKGFRGGGWDLRLRTGIGNPLTSEDIAFDPETIANYELGLRHEWPEQKTRLNVTAFHMDYQNVQVRTFEGPFPISIIRNAAEASSTGFEAELTSRMVDNLDVSMGIGYTDASFDTFENCDGAGGSCTGNPLQGAPEWTLSAGVAHTTVLSGGVQLTSRVDYAYRTSLFFDTLARPQFTSGDVHNLNGRITLSDEEGRYSISLFGRNLLNQKPRNYAAPGFFPGSEEASFAPPRMWGVELRTAF